MNIDQKDLYEKALNEVEKQDDSFSRGIWALALVQCDGNEEKAKIKYISLRVEELTSESKVDLVVRKDEQKIDELIIGSSDQSESVTRQDMIEALENIDFIIEKLHPEQYIFQKNYARLTYPDQRKISFRSKDDFYYEISRIYKKYILEKNTYSSHDDILESKSQTKNQDNFLSKIYNGGYSLPVTYWVFGVGISIIFRILGSSNMMLALLFLLLNITYTFLICVGIWRAADNYNGEHYWASLAKFAVIFSIGATILSILFEVI